MKELPTHHLYRGVLLAVWGEEEVGPDLVMRGWEIMHETRMFLKRFYFLYRFGRLSARLGVLEGLANTLDHRREKLLEECEAARHSDRIEPCIRRLLSDISLTIPR